MRDLLTTLHRDHGTTILVSSHLLPEIERLVTHAGIINKGTMIFQGSYASLAAKREASSETAIGSSDNERARINRLLVERGVDVHEITTSRNDLERIFLDLIGGRTW